MYRTNYKRFWRHLGMFLWDNRRLLVFLALFFIGVATGCTLYSDLGAEHQSLLSGLWNMAAVAPTFGGFLSAVLSEALLLLLLVTVLMLSGLSVCGAPVIAAVPLCYGLGIGMLEASYLLSGGGAGVLVILVVMPALLAVWTLLMACSESLRMTLRLAAQLLPSSSHSGGLWPDFKLYFFRFLIFVALTFAAALLSVCVRWMYS